MIVSKNESHLVAKHYVAPTVFSSLKIYSNVHWGWPAAGLLVYLCSHSSSNIFMY
jgi:hypothetical protein